jgi:hypothetical protein
LQLVARSFPPASGQRPSPPHKGTVLATQRGVRVGGGGEELATEGQNAWKVLTGCAGPMFHKRKVILTENCGWGYPPRQQYPDSAKEGAEVMLFSPGLPAISRRPESSSRIVSNNHVRAVGADLPDQGVRPRGFLSRRRCSARHRRAIGRSRTDRRWLAAGGRVPRQRSSHRRRR